MSKTDAEMKVVETFEKLADRFGMSPQDMFAVIKEEYGEEEPSPDEIADEVMADIEDTESTEDTPEENTEDTEEVHYRKDGEVCQIAGPIEECYHHDKENEHSPKNDEDTPEDTESDDWNQPAFENPNSKDWYNQPEAIMSESAIKAHPKFEKMNISVVKLQHKQGVNGVCEKCELAYAGKGDLCSSCHNEEEKSDTGKFGGYTFSNEDLANAAKLVENTSMPGISNVEDAKEHIAQNAE